LRKRAEKGTPNPLHDADTSLSGRARVSKNEIKRTSGGGGPTPPSELRHDLLSHAAEHISRTVRTVNKAKSVSDSLKENLYQGQDYFIGQTLATNTIYTACSSPINDLVIVKVQLLSSDGPTKECFAWVNLKRDIQELGSTWCYIV